MKRSPGGRSVWIALWAFRFPWPTEEQAGRAPGGSWPPSSLLREHDRSTPPRDQSRLSKPPLLNLAIKALPRCCSAFIRQHGWTRIHEDVGYSSDCVKSSWWRRATAGSEPNHENATVGGSGCPQGRHCHCGRGAQRRRAVARRDDPQRHAAASPEAKEAGRGKEGQMLLRSRADGLRAT